MRGQCRVWVRFPEVRRLEKRYRENMKGSEELSRMIHRGGTPNAGLSCCGVNGLGVSVPEVRRPEKL